MSTERNLATVRRFFDEIHHHRLNVLNEFCAPDYVVHFPGTPGPLSREAIKPVWEQFFAAFPALSHTIEDIFADGDRVVIRMKIEGVQTGEFMGLPPTGRAISMSSINFVRCVDGLIVEQWNNYDALGMLQQLGAIPSPQTATA